MSEENTTEQTPDVVQSLDDVIEEFQPQQFAEPAPQQYQEQAAPQPQVPQTTLDPFDQAQMDSFSQNTANQFGQMSNQMAEMQARLNQADALNANAAIDKDVKNAVDIVNKIAGHKDSSWIEFQINKKADENVGFRAIWENRAANPQAYQKALTAIGNELKSGTDSQSDPQLVENQRAVEQSQQNINSNTAEVSTLEQTLADSTSEADRQAIWDAATQGY